MARYTHEEKALMVYALNLMAGESHIWNDETHDKIFRLIDKVDTPFIPNDDSGLYNKKYQNYMKSWESK